MKIPDKDVDFWIPGTLRPPEVPLADATPPASQQNSEAQLVTHAYTPATGSMREKPTQRRGFEGQLFKSLKM